MIKKRMRIAITARMGDPLVQAARARLIWAAQTSQATSDLGFDVVLVGSGNNLPVKVEGPVGVTAIKRIVAGFYNVAGDFDIMPLYPPDPNKDRPAPYGGHEANNLFPRYVQPYVDLVHTRDPRIVGHCIKANIPVIFEDHNEDYHLSGDALNVNLNHPNVRAVVAITASVADRLVLMGINRTKIIVQDSGVNQRALERVPERANAWRRSLLRNSKHKYLAVYAGGLQVERGIGHIINAALHMPDVMFAMAGGNRKDIGMWIQQAKEMNLSNVRFLSYLPQDQAIALQQAGDVALMTRQAGARGTITSPLKFFEYLASGTPALCATTPVLAAKNTEGLAVTWYDPTNEENLIPALRETFEKFPRRIDGYSQNIEYVYAYTWQERQKNILAFAGADGLMTAKGA